MIDTHTHLHMTSFDADRDDVLSRAANAGILAILEVGVDLQSSRKVIECCQQCTSMYGAVGVHPHDAVKMDEADWKSINELLDHPKVKALGEIGLDFHYDFSPRDIQKDVFRKQLNLAKEKSKPVLVHIRKAMEDGLKIIEEVGPLPQGGVFHCFNGSVEDVNRIISNGFYLSFTGMVTFRSFQEFETVQAVPLSRMLLETDSPYMTPSPHRGKRNEPAYLVHTAQKIAMILDMPL